MKVKIIQNNHQMLESIINTWLENTDVEVKKVEFIQRPGNMMTAVIFYEPKKPQKKPTRSPTI